MMTTVRVNRGWHLEGYGFFGILFSPGGKGLVGTIVINAWKLRSFFSISLLKKRYVRICLQHYYSTNFRLLIKQIKPPEKKCSTLNDPRLKTPHYDATPWLTSNKKKAPPEYQITHKSTGKSPAHNFEPESHRKIITRRERELIKFYNYPFNVSDLLLLLLAIEGLAKLHVVTFIMTMPYGFTPESNKVWVWNGLGVVWQ